MRISLIISLFDRNWVLSIGTEYSKDDEEPVTVLDGVDLHSQTEISHPVGFQRNEEWEDDDDE